MIKISLRYKGKTCEIEFDSNATGKDLFNSSVKFSGLNANRCRVVINQNGKRVPVNLNQKLSEMSEHNFEIRDLGPQFSYYGVFLMEYFGPFLIWPIARKVMNPDRSIYIQLATVMWAFHYAKRLFETHFVHTFSHATMPLRNLFKNCTYYWGFAALIAFTVNGTDKEVGTAQISAFAAFFVCEFLNLYCHLKLRWLRPKGSTAHVLPRGFLFERIACPNYTFEILSWVAFAVFVRVWPAVLFPICGAAQMFVWADEKRKRLAAEFPEAKRRGRITPFRLL